MNSTNSFFVATNLPTLIKLKHGIPLYFFQIEGVQAFFLSQSIIDPGLFPVVTLKDICLTQLSSLLVLAQSLCSIPSLSVFLFFSNRILLSLIHIPKNFNPHPYEIYIYTNVFIVWYYDGPIQI